MKRFYSTVQHSLYLFLVVALVGCVGTESPNVPIDNGSNNTIDSLTTPLTVNPIYDTYVSQESPTTSFTTATLIKTDGNLVNDAKNSYLEFHVSGVLGTVQSIKLRLFLTADANAGSPDRFSIRKILNSPNTALPTATSQLNGMNYTWNTPANHIDSAIVASKTGFTGNAANDITIPASFFQGDGYYAIAIVDSNGTNAIYYNSMEAAPAKRPQLIINYIPGTGGSVPAAPTAFAANASSTPTINLTWSDNSSDETMFEITRATDNAFTQNVVTINTAANAQTATDTIPSTTTTYYYQIKAINNYGASSAATAVVTPVQSSQCAVPNVAMFGTLNITSSSASPYWTAVSGANSYNVEYRIRNVGASYSSPISTSMPSIALTPLQAASNYEFIVQSVCSGSVSAFSSSGWFTTTAATSTCNAPTGLSASAITNTAATLNWSAATNAVSYNAQYRKIGTSAWSAAASSTTSKGISGLMLGTNYEFQVQSVCASSSSAFSGSANFMTTGGTTTNAVPQFNKIVVVIGENTNASAVFGSADAPYINSLASSGLKFSEAYAVSHPSQPNYIQLYSGSNQGITDDNLVTTKFTTPNLGKELINAGKSYTTYSENLPSVGFDGATATGGYARKHNAAANWMGTGTNQIPTTTNQPFTAFPTNFSTLPSVSFVVPNLCDDGHDVCAPLNNRTKQFDSWVQAHMDAYKQWAIANNSLLIVTYDEDDFTAVNKISTVFYGAHMLVGNYAQHIDHYNVLRTIEDAMGLTSHAGAAATATPIDYCWVP